jgi:hypothetical protein
MNSVRTQALPPPLFRKSFPEYLPSAGHNAYEPFLQRQGPASSVILRNIVARSSSIMKAALPRLRSAVTVTIIIITVGPHVPTKQA